MRVLVIIPAYNEALVIRNTIEELRMVCPDYDYIVVNDASKDGTKRILDAGKYNYLNLPTNLGIGGAIQTGYKYAKEKGYDIAIQMDGDGQHDPQYYSDAVSIIANGEADYVIGSRFINKEGFQTSFMRRFGIKFLSTLIKLVCGETVLDVTSGYRIINRSLIEFFAEEYAQDYPEPEAIIAANCIGARIKEIPVMMRERSAGESSISPLKSILYMTKVSLSILLYKMTVKKKGR